MPTVCWKISAFKFYKYIVNEKVDHIDNVVSSLARLGPKRICDKVFES